MALPQIFKLEENLYEEFESVLDKINVGNKFVTVCGVKFSNKIAYDFIEHCTRYKLLPPIEVEKATIYAAFKVRTAAEKENSPVIGFGGGKISDTTKLGASDANKPAIIVNTQPTHDGTASNVVSIDQYGKPYSVPVKPPTAVILPMPIHYQCSPETIKKGIGDSLAKISANLDWKLSEELKSEKQKDPPYNENVSYLCVQPTMEIIENIKKREEEGPFVPDKEFISILDNALVSYGINMCTIGSTVCASGSGHLYGHGLDVTVKNRLPHGIVVGGIGLMNSIGLYETFLPDFFVKFFENFGFKTMSLGGLKELEDYLHMTYQARKLGITEEDVISAYLKGVKIGDERGRVTIYDDIRFYREPKIEIDREFARKYLTRFDLL